MDRLLKGYLQSSIIAVKYVNHRGKGGRAVYARKNIDKHSMIEWAPCLIIPEDEIGWDWTKILPWYVFEWNKVDGVKMNALGLGYVSLYNHSYNPNAIYEMEKPDCITIWAHKDIKKDEEITINYNSEPDCQNAVSFPVGGSKRKKKGKH